MADPWSKLLPTEDAAFAALLGQMPDGVITTRAPMTAKERRAMQRRAMAGIEPTPQERVNMALDDPRLQQNSEMLADVGAVGASLLAPIGPLVGAASRVAPPVWAGLAGAYGLTAGAPGADTNESADLREVRKMLQDRGSPELTRLYGDLEKARSRQSTLDQQAGKARPGSQARSAAAGRAELAADIKTLETAIQSERERIGLEANQRAEAVMQGRIAGEEARNRERSKAPPTFTEWYSGLQKEAPLLPPAWALPIAAGAGAVGLSKAMSIPSAWFGRGKASAALGRGEYEAAEQLAKAHAPGGFASFAKDAGIGAGAGFTLGATPLAADLMMQPQSNPERAAQFAYTNELLDIDPRRPRSEAYAQSLPQANPALEKAQDWTAWARGIGAGAIEGAVGGKLAGIAADALKPTFTNVQAEAARQRAAAAAASNTAGGPRGNRANVPQSPLSNIQGYPPPGSSGREFLRREYRDQYSSALQPPNPGSFNAAAQAEAAAAGGRLPQVQRRVKETNAAVQEFVQKNGRPPVTDADWSQIFRRTGTLAVPLMASPLWNMGEE